MSKFYKKRSVAAAVESLESRTFLSATLEAQIPTQNLTVGKTAPTITLSNFLVDPQITSGTVIEMQTPEGNMFFQLTDAATPGTVNNFVSYINNGQYVPTIIQRLAPGFVLQGGGTKPDGSNNAPNAPIQSEASLSNTIGTIAMALNSNGKDSATNQWFINIGNNDGTGSTENLNDTSDGGPFTAFGKIIDGTLSVANTIAGLPAINASAENGNWSALPVIGYSGSQTPTTVPQNALVTDYISVVPAAQAVPTYSVISANPNLVTASITDGVLTLTPAANAVSGSTTVTATITDLAGETATSEFSVNVTGTSPAQITFVQPPVNAKAGHAISPAVTVKVTDGSGNLLTGAKVKIAIASGPAGGVLDGTLKAVSQNGIATFSDLSITEAGSYSLVANHGGLKSEVSRTFTIRHIAAHQLVFTQQPGATAVNSPVSPAIEVTVEDKYGNVVVSDGSSVTLAIKDGTGPAGAILSGTIPEPAELGVAMFSDIKLNEIGSYRLIATDGGLTKAKSARFSVLAGS